MTIDIQQSAKLDVYYPPTNIEFKPTYEGKILTAQCSITEAYPEPTIDIPWTNGKTLITDSSEPTKKSFSYELTPTDKVMDVNKLISFYVSYLRNFLTVTRSVLTYHVDF